MAALSSPTAGRVDYLVQEAPYGRLFPRVETRSDVLPHRLDDEQVRLYREHGYLHRLAVFSPEQVLRLRAALESIVQGRNGRESELLCRSNDQAGATRLTYLQGGWMIDPDLHDLIFHPAITVKVAQLLDVRKVRFWHDQVFYKPPRVGGNVAWHQDYSYWLRTTPSQHLSVWIGLDDSTLENGCLQVVPDSHRWGLLRRDELLGDMDALKQQLTAEQVARFVPVPLEQPAGTCSFHHDHTIHGSYRNESERPRRAIILNFMADGTRSHADDGIMMPGYQPIPKGQPISGRMFPLVLDLDALSGA
jgi:hypothetical protein